MKKKTRIVVICVSGFCMLTALLVFLLYPLGIEGYWIGTFLGSLENQEELFHIVDGDVIEYDIENGKVYRKDYWGKYYKVGSRKYMITVPKGDPSIEAVIEVHWSYIAFTRIPGMWQEQRFKSISSDEAQAFIDTWENRDLKTKQKDSATD